MSDEKLNIDPLAGVRLKKFSKFEAPESSRESKQFFADIDRALEKDRAARRSDDAAEESSTTEVATAAAAAAQAFVSKTKTVSANKDKAKEGAAGQRGSAASVFNRLQESLVSKQNEIAKKQLSTQEDIKEASQQAASTLNSAFGGGALGLAAVLG
jgi:thiol:disulfide interchange protein